MNPQERAAANERFFKRLLARRPQDREEYEKRLKEEAAKPVLEAVGGEEMTARQRALETIVSEERPVLFIQNGGLNTQEVTIRGPEAQDLVDRLKAASSKVLPLLPLVGRIDVANFPNNLPFLGTGWFVADDIVVTNRHVAKLIAENNGGKYEIKLGMDGLPLATSFNNAHEYDDAPNGPDRVFKIAEVLYIERDTGPNDIAFLRVDRKPSGLVQSIIPISDTDVGPDELVCVLGYPARAPRSVIPDQGLMRSLYLDRYDVKRAAPGYTDTPESGLTRHDCTTLGGNSGSVLVSLVTGRAVGLHFSGLYKQANYAMRASELSAYVNRKQWLSPVVIEGVRPVAPAPVPVPVAPVTLQAPVAVGGDNQVMTMTFPLTVSVSISLGQPVAPVAAMSTVVVPDAAARPPLTVERVEQAASAFWRKRPTGAVAVRVGYADDGNKVGDQPCIAVSVLPDLWAGFEAKGPHEFDGVPIRYQPAEVSEQIEAMALTESVTSISYDDDARIGEAFSFDTIDEEMEVLLHVGPEYSWDVLHDFLGGAKVEAIDERLKQGAPMDDAVVQGGHLVSAMYEFHGPHIKDALEARLNNGATLDLVLDNASFSKVKDPGMEFDRTAVFAAWAQNPHFKRIVAPEGISGLISDAYHIKVTVRDDDTIWHSSGNWKMGSSQPVITPEQLANAAAGRKDLPGNREWHVVIRNKTLAGRFRSHITQDFKRSKDLGGGPLPKSQMEETFVDVPVEEAVVLERPAPSGVVKPLLITGAVKVRPLLTPDRKGAVYSEAVLRLIRSAKKSLLFQIPYIGMPSSPDADRGYIDELINALTEKLTSLDDARVILRAGGAKYSSPTHAAWFFKSKGVDIDNRLSLIDDSHTKGMIVDGKRVLIGSHNWSAPGVTLNRDASLIFDNKQAAEYYTEAFEIDWARSRSINPKQFVKKAKEESVVLEAVGDSPPQGYKRIPLSEWLKDD